MDNDAANHSKVKMPNSFFKRSARNGPTPFKYSIGELNMDEVVLIIIFISNKYLNE